MRALREARRRSRPSPRAARRACANSSAGLVTTRACRPSRDGEEVRPARRALRIDVALVREQQPRPSRLGGRAVAGLRRRSAPGATMRRMRASSGSGSAPSGVTTTISAKGCARGTRPGLGRRAAPAAARHSETRRVRRRRRRAAAAASASRSSQLCSRLPPAERRVARQARRDRARRRGSGAASSGVLAASVRARSASRDQFRRAAAVGGDERHAGDQAFGDDAGAVLGAARHHRQHAWPAQIFERLLLSQFGDQRRRAPASAAYAPARRRRNARPRCARTCQGTSP